MRCREIESTEKRQRRRTARGANGEVPDGVNETRKFVETVIVSFVYRPVESGRPI
jgi:hypothetical protein